MIKKLVFIIFICQIFISCGFTPSLKVEETNKAISQIHYEIQDSSYIARQTLKTFLKSANQNEARYISYINVVETESAVNIASNGSVLEYKIEVLIDYRITEPKSEKLIHTSKSRGFSNYDVSTSEYNNN